ncbi:MAG: mechanosensitive ion channel family protein [Candidatus Zapsychrus exili]|nr:mechanosensitive ion channel family protein [Candidatus Zapsychrus exili]
MANEFINQIFLGNSIKSYLFCLAFFSIFLIVIRIFQNIILSRLKTWSEKTHTSIDDFLVELIRKVFVPLAYVGVAFASINTLNLTDFAKKSVNILSIGVLTLLVARFITAFIGYGFKVYWRKRGKDIEVERSLSGLLRILNFIVWALAVVFFLDNLGFKISAVIAGLGIGGVAVALAAQAVLGDLFSYFSILFDRPFEVGDFIIVGDYLGVVENIGIKTTRISSLSGEQLIFSNSDLTSSRVRNYKRMEKRRVVFKLGVTYDTSSKRVKEIPEIIKSIIEEIKEATFDRSHFLSFADFSLVYETVYYVASSDYNKYMDIQQDINFRIKEEFEKRDIEFAYPTQTLYVNKDE